VHYNDSNEGGKSPSRNAIGRWPAWEA